MPRVLSDWLQSYVDLFDQHSESPTRLHFWTGVSTLAGALTRHVYIDEMTYRYYPNFCIIFVAPPGVVSKSTTISLGHSILSELDHIKFAADTTSYPAFVKALAGYITEFREQVNGSRLTDEWTTQCAVTASISELGTFLNVEDKISVNGLTDLLDCRSGIITKDTKTAGTDEIQNPFVNIIGATTPNWVQDNLKANIGGWGLSSRIIFVFADRKKRYIHRPSTEIVNKRQFYSARQQLVDDLKRIGDLSGPFSFSDAADATLKTWYEQSCARMEAHQESPDYDPWIDYYLARKTVHANKLAMIFSVARSNSLIIDDDAMTKAIAAVDDLEQHIIEVFKPKALPTTLALNEQAILERISQELQTKGQLTKATTVARATRYIDSTSAIRIIDNAIKRGMLLATQKGSQIWISLPPAPAAESENSP